MLLLTYIAKGINRNEDDFVQDLLGDVGEGVFQAIGEGRPVDKLDLLGLIPAAVRIPDQYQASLRGALTGFATRLRYRASMGEAPGDAFARKDWYKRIWSEMPASVMGVGGPVTRSERVTLADALGRLEGVEFDRAIEMFRVNDDDAQEDKAWKVRANAMADVIDVSLEAFRGVMKIDGADPATRKLRQDRLRAMIKLPPEPPKAVTGVVDGLKKLVSAAAGTSVVKAVDPEQIAANIQSVGQDSQQYAVRSDRQLHVQRTLVKRAREKMGRQLLITLGILVILGFVLAGTWWLLHAYGPDLTPYPAPATGNAHHDGGAPVSPGDAAATNNNHVGGNAGRQ
jgi:hypothetical protein